MHQSEHPDCLCFWLSVAATLSVGITLHTPQQLWRSSLATASGCPFVVQILLYETIAGIVVVGLWATTSLLVRHWDAIENFDKRVPEEVGSRSLSCASESMQSPAEPDHIGSL